MDSVHAYASDIAFTASVKAIQTRKGSRRSYKHMEERGSWQTRITPDLARFIEAQTSIFLATANAEGQPYIQHRGGPPGFLKMLDDKTSALPISPAIGNTSRRAISWTTPRRIFFDRLYTAETHLNYVSQCP
jgi:predicted pyridoxine 5'-phosphate oxidase superfamily flavin-nucleotide-binding protein